MIAALLRLFEELKVPANEDRLASRIHYWCGFARWRRAFNGFNDGVDRLEIEADLRQTLSEFDAALGGNPRFVDAKVGAISCLQNLAFLYRIRNRLNGFVSRFVALLDAALSAAPNNPRLLWVHGASQWWAPAGTPESELARRQARAMATYERGLALAREQKEKTSDPLEPAWGEPELLMNLASSSLNRTAPDARVAERYAQEALALVPNWRYVRDILMARIRKAKGSVR